MGGTGIGLGYAAATPAAVKWFPPGKKGLIVGLVCTMQAMVMFFFPYFNTVNDFIIGSIVVGFNYGACLSLFPATTADYWGTKNLGLNYGILFTSWGVGGIFGPILAGKIADATGAYVTAYTTAAGLLLLAVFLAMVSYINISVSIPERQITIRVGVKQEKLQTNPVKA